MFAYRVAFFLTDRDVNRAIALAETEGPAVSLRLLDELDLDTYRYFHSTRADLLRRLGRDSEARGAYWALTDGLPFLLDRQGDTVEIFELVAM